MVSTLTVWQHQGCDTAKTAKSSSVLVLVLWGMMLPCTSSPKPNLYHQEDPPQTAQSAPLFSCRSILFGHQMVGLQGKPWWSQGAFYRVREGHGRKSLSDCTGGSWVAVPGLCHRFVHVLGVGASCPAAVQGCGSSRAHGSWPVGCAPGLLCQTGRRDRGDFSSLSPRSGVQEFALPWDGVVETEG